MASTALRDETELNPTLIYKRPYIRPRGAVAKQILKITAATPAQTVTTAPSVINFQIPTSQRVYRLMLKMTLRHGLWAPHPVPRPHRQHRRRCV